MAGSGPAFGPVVKAAGRQPVLAAAAVSGRHALEAVTSGDLAAADGRFTSSAEDDAGPAREDVSARGHAVVVQLRCNYCLDPWPRKGPKVRPLRFRSPKDSRQAIRFTANARYYYLATLPRHSRRYPSQSLS